jgi:hypothetical protein
MEYLALIVWLLLIILMGMGVYELLARLLRPAWVNWLLLPGTIVSEMAYILGCLITGGEVRSKIIPSGGGSGGAGGGGGGKGGGGPATESKGGMKFISPMVASTLAIFACAAAVVVLHSALGKPVIRQFPLEVPQQQLPTSWGGFWSLLHYQVSLLQHTVDALGGLPWLDWKVPLFVYLSICLAVRLAPSRRPVRPTLAAAACVAVLIALAGLISSQFRGLTYDIWPLVTYVWAMLLLVMCASAATIGITRLVKAVAGSGGAKGKAKAES